MISEGYKNFLVTLIASFVGSLLAISLALYLHKPSCTCCGCGMPPMPPMSGIEHPVKPGHGPMAGPKDFGKGHFEKGAKGPETMMPPGEPKGPQPAPQGATEPKAPKK
jgi:hypothetical protein